jgi:hypothetical protein
VGGRIAVLEPVNVDPPRFEVDLIPAEINHLGDPQTVPKGQIPIKSGLR